MVAGRAGGVWGGGVGEDLSLTRTSSPPDPPKSIHLNPFHYTATKSSFTPLEVTTGQDKIYGHTAHSSWRPVVLPNRHIHLCLFKQGYDVRALLSSVLYILSGENITAVYSMSRRGWDQNTTQVANRLYWTRAIHVWLLHLTPWFPPFSNCQLIRTCQILLKNIKYGKHRSQGPQPLRSGRLHGPGPPLLDQPHQRRRLRLALHFLLLPHLSAPPTLLRRGLHRPLLSSQILPPTFLPLRPTSPPQVMVTSTTRHRSEAKQMLFRIRSIRSSWNDWLIPSHSQQYNFSSATTTTLWTALTTRPAGSPTDRPSLLEATSTGRRRSGLGSRPNS